MNLQVNCETGSLPATHCQHPAICQRHMSPFSLHTWLLSQCWAHVGWLHRPTGKVSNQTLNEWFIFFNRWSQSLMGAKQWTSIYLRCSSKLFFFDPDCCLFPEYVFSVNVFDYFYLDSNFILDSHLIVNKSDRHASITSLVGVSGDLVVKKCCILPVWGTFLECHTPLSFLIFPAWISPVTAK